MGVTFDLSLITHGGMICENRHDQAFGGGNLPGSGAECPGTESSVCGIVVRRVSDNVCCWRKRHRFHSWISTLELFRVSPGPSPMHRYTYIHIAWPVHSLPSSYTTPLPVQAEKIRSPFSD